MLLPESGNAYTVGFSDGAGQGSIVSVSVGQTIFKDSLGRKIT